MGGALIQYKKANHSDLPQLGEIRSLAIMAQPENFWDANDKKQAADAWPKRSIHKEFEQYKVYIFTNNNDVIGYVGWKEDYLGYLFVLPQHQSIGIGTKMLNFAETKIKKAHNQIWLWALPYGENFYLKNGFTKTNETEIPFGEKPVYKFLKSLKN